MGRVLKRRRLVRRRSGRRRVAKYKRNLFSAYKMLQKASAPLLGGYYSTAGVYGPAPCRIIYCNDQSAWGDSAALKVSYGADNTHSIYIPGIDTPEMVDIILRMAGVVVPTGKRYILGNRTLEYCLSNFETSELELRVYVCNARSWMLRSTNVNDGDASSGGDLIDITKRLLAKDGQAFNPSNIAQNLFDSTTWCSNFRVRKVLRYKIAAGGCKKFKFTHRKPWLLTNRFLNAQDYAAWPRGKFLLFEAWTQPMFENNGGVNFQHVGVGKCAFGITCQMDSKLYQMNATFAAQGTYTPFLQAAITTPASINHPVAAVTNQV